MKKAIIIFSGYNQRAVISLLRTLESNKVNHGIKYGIIASSKEDTIFLTKYSKNVLRTREEKQLILSDLLKSIEVCKSRLRADSYVIAPSTEALNRFLLDNRSEFEQIGCEVPIVGEDLYENISDKYKFGQMCQNNNILVPKEYQDIDEAPLPFVAKPKTYFTDSGKVYTPFLINNENEKQQFLSECDLKDFYFQEFITGECLYLLYYFYKDGTFAKFSQNNKVQQPDGKSIIAAESSDFHNSRESTKYEKLFVDAGYSGLIMVEIKRQDSRNYMIEANPRFWGPSQLFVDAGVNLFEDFLFDNRLLTDKPERPKVKKVTKYFWYGGLVESIKNHNYVAYHGYSKDQFDKELKDWAAADVYNREDTKDLFEQEMNI